jgi:cytoplasmic iron level regulating protein YaaA (DUF328/UPF0246 family)
MVSRRAPRRGVTLWLVLLLLPPSEGKTPPPPGRAASLDDLAHAGVLGPLRERLIPAVDPSLAAAPAAPARDVYTGVLFGKLDLGSLPPAARRRARDRVLIASGLWGLVRPSDRIPVYKLPIGTSVPGVGALAAAWRPAVGEALAERDVPRELVLDCRSGAYATVWRPAHATHVEVRAFRVRPDGTRQVISHMAKASRGEVARAALLAPRAPRTPDDVAAAAASAGLDVELACANGDRRRWTLDVLER